jgi:ABC-type Mn2+/Zn2+ transport system permease subunit
VATTAGTTAAQVFHRQPGPLVVLVASGCFVVSLFWRPVRAPAAARPG